GEMLDGLVPVLVHPDPVAAIGHHLIAVHRGVDVQRRPAVIPRAGEEEHSVTHVARYEVAGEGGTLRDGPGGVEIARPEAVAAVAGDGVQLDNQRLADQGAAGPGGVEGIEAVFAVAGNKVAGQGRRLRDDSPEGRMVSQIYAVAAVAGDGIVLQQDGL